MADAPTTFDHARQMMQVGEYEKAVIACSHLLQLSPHGEFYCLRAEAYVEIGQLSLAMADVDAALAIDPYNALAHCRKGEIFWANGNIERALSELQIAISQHDGCYEAHNNLGAVHYEAGDFHSAVERFSRALALSPEYGAAYANRGRAYAALDNVMKAEADLVRAIEIIRAPRHLSSAYCSLGLVEFRMEKFIEAADAFDCAKRATGDIEATYLVFGAYAKFQLAESAGDFREQKKWLESAMEDAEIANRRGCEGAALILERIRNALNHVNQPRIHHQEEPMGFGEIRLIRRGPRRVSQPYYGNIQCGGCGLLYWYTQPCCHRCGCPNPHCPY
ncbi:tetratricopeptide repeat protein [Bremerella sp. P1]|uniref:tetratricopeptide repeat protein n=1 Tax=Bremerella sp. P1 TaxID=3026424 RepID=UPI00236762CB|nr:tetratricopeptide repeat protein [Bremerella sp. P1]WDI43721.1 tetratricopeptide repeat protein [Bremerella sp. P1]